MTDTRWQGKTHAQLGEDLDDWASRQPVTQRCLFCPWTWEGTAGEGRQHSRQHRATYHPNAAQPSKRRRKLVGLDTPQTLAAARAKGSFATRTTPRP